jgi:hypothetical protein
MAVGLGYSCRGIFEDVIFRLHFVNITDEYKTFDVGNTSSSCEIFCKSGAIVGENENLDKLT